MIAHRQMIESRQNPTIKRLKELREAKGRREQERFLIDGPREIARALKRQAKIAAAYFCRSIPFEQETLKALEAKKVELIELGKSAFEAVCYRENPEGIVAEAITWSLRLDDLRLKNPTLVVIAEDIEKPGNLGTLLRTCDAAGVQALIGCNQAVDLFNPNTLRASAGAVFSVPYASARREDVLSWLKKQSLCLVAASPASGKNPWQADLKKPFALAIGSEAWGLSREMLNAADATVRLPMLGLGDSLNVSVATGAILYEALRQRSG